MMVVGVVVNANGARKVGDCGGSMYMSTRTPSRRRLTYKKEARQTHTANNQGIIEEKKKIPSSDATVSYHIV